MKTTYPACLLLAATALSAPCVHAARPFATEDAGTLAKGSCELEAVAEQSRARAEAKVRTSTAQGACGVGASTQVGFGFSQTRAADGRSRSLTVSGKTLLIDGGDKNPSLTVAYGGDFARKALGEGAELNSTAAMLVVTVPAGDWGTLHANLGAQQQRRPDKVNSGIWALALEKPVSSTVDVGIETYGDARSPAWVGLGLRWTPSAGVSLNASAAQQSGQDRAKAFSLGVKFDF